MFEHRRQKLISKHAFSKRLLRYFLYSTLFLCFSLSLGVVGYKVTSDMDWLQALLNASMILTGMGPVDCPHSNAGKLFASFYALYSGLAFLTSAGIIVTPILHRLLHSLHLEDME